MRGLQCPKSLYLNKYHRDLKDNPDPSLEAVFRSGKEVGELAQGLFPDGFDASPPDPFHYQDSVRLTKRLIDEGTDVIYEAAFQHNQVLAAVDILVRSGESWRAFEVKSSTSVKDPFIWDVALQYYVMNGSGIELGDIAVVTINNEYVRHGELNLHQLFSQDSLIGQARELQPQVAEFITLSKTVLAGGEIPDVDIGPYCSDPYDCNFMGHCWSHIPDDSIFTLGRLRKEKKFQLYHGGIVQIEDIPETFSLGRTAQIQADAHVNNKSTIKHDHIENFLNSLKYPLYFLDFETFNIAIPPIDNSRPYQQIPYQYSLHSKSSPDGEVSHSGFLIEVGIDPRRVLAEALLRETEGPGDILVYNRSFEAGVIKSLAKLIPDLSSDLEALLSRLVDLMEPFRKQHYYLPQMKGSYSIKAVLPALVPELRYDELDVQDGMQAMDAYLQLAHENDATRISEIRSALWEYCKLDTYAMVCILEKLEPQTGG